MRLSEIKEHLENLTGQITFKYNDKNCGVDPLSLNEFDVWYGDDMRTADSIDEVISNDLFDGKALRDILDDVVDLEY